MIYPKSWDVTPITYKQKIKTYQGVSDGVVQTLNVRMQFGYVKIVSKDGIGIDGAGIFYKYGSLELKKEDKISFDGNNYEIAKKREFRLNNGIVEYTKIWFK